MKALNTIDVRFVAGFGPIVRDAQASQAFYRQTLGLTFKEEKGGYLHTEALTGVKTFALWPLEQAAQSCFGVTTWPSELAVPQAWLEFDVDDVARATTELERQGYRVVLKNKVEPWGQTVTRLLSPEGLLVGITFTPALRET